MVHYSFYQEELRKQHNGNITKGIALLRHFYATFIISDFKYSQNVYKLQKAAFFVL